jgi:flagella basal body P-ring formation protein FlgA
MKSFEKILKLFLFAAIAFSIPANLLFAQSTFSAERIEELANKYIQGIYGDNAIPEILVGLNTLTFDQKGVKAKFSFKENHTSAIQELSLSFFANDELIKTFSIPFRIKIIMQVIVANRDIFPNEQIEPDAITYSNRQISDVNEIIQNESEVLGKNSRKKIKKGEVITKSQLSSNKVIKKGQSVNLEVTSGSVRILTTAVAMQDGSVGDYIRLKRNSDNTKQDVEGQVISGNLVQIKLK